MIVCYVPIRGIGTMMVMAFTAEDLAKLASGETEPDLIDSREAMRTGLALPSMVQVIAVQDEAEFAARMQAWFDKNDAGVDITEFRELSDLPKLWTEDDE